MKVKKATTQPGLFGVTLYFDTCGNKIGEARPHGILERIDYYDEHGNFKGYSEKAALGRRIYYDAQGTKTGTSEMGMLESIIYYDNRGRKTGVSEKAPLGGTTYYEIKEQPGILTAIKEHSLPIQINAYSLSETSDEKVKSFARKLLQEKLVTFIGSDAHGTGHRPVKLESGIQYIYDNCNPQYAEAICYRNAEQMILNIATPRRT